MNISQPNSLAIPALMSFVKLSIVMNSYYFVGEFVVISTALVVGDFYLQRVGNNWVIIMF